MSRIGIVLAALALLPAPAEASQPTRLRLEARTADGLYSDGRRYAVITRGDDLTILDTHRRTRRTVADTGCFMGGIQFGQAQVHADGTLLSCPSGPTLLSLRSGGMEPLPADVGYFYAVGAHWAVAEDRGRSVFVNHRTGEQRIVRLRARDFYDLDDPALARQTVCAPHRGVMGYPHRLYEPPYLLDDGTLKRCGSRRAVRKLPDALPDMMDLSAGRLSWGDPFPPPASRRVHLFDLRLQRRFTWRVPGGRPGTAVHTRREILVAATLRANREADPVRIRVYRGRVPPRG